MIHFIGLIVIIWFGLKIFYWILRSVVVVAVAAERAEQSRRFTEAKTVDADFSRAHHEHRV